MSLRTNALKDNLHNDGIEIDYIRLVDTHRGLYIADGSKSYIAIAPDLPPKQQLAVLAHEAGHHYTGITGHTGRDEERANRWAAKELISPEAIIQATLAGCQSYHELCEMLDLDEEFVRTAIKCFRSIYGEGIQFDDYYLHLHPIWVKDIQTGKVWPEE